MAGIILLAAIMAAFYVAIGKILLEHNRQENEMEIFRHKAEEERFKNWCLVNKGTYPPVTELVPTEWLEEYRKDIAKFKRKK